MRRLLIAVAVMSLAFGIAVSPAAADGESEATNYALQAGDNPSSSFDLCKLTGVRDGVYGFGGVTLTHYHNFLFPAPYEVWVHCRVRIPRQVGEFTVYDYHDWVIDRDRAHLYSGTYHGANPHPS